MSEVEKRAVRSFVLRNSRITGAQERALTALWPDFGIDYDNDTDRQPLSLDTIFGRTSACILEVGFGDGESLLTQAQSNPDTDYLGLEVYRPGIGHLLLRLKELGLDNLRIICADAVDVMNNALNDDSLAGIQVFFPDPWPKKRHHKRRLIQPAFSRLAAKKLRKGGKIHLATDWQDYAEHMLNVLRATPGLINCYADFVPPPPPRPPTKFEKRGQRLGHKVWDLIFKAE